MSEEQRCQGCEDAPLGQHTGPHDWETKSESACGATAVTLKWVGSDIYDFVMTCNRVAGHDGGHVCYFGSDWFFWESTPEGSEGK